VTGGLVIVGGCHAGVQAAATAREAGYAEPITLITDDPDPPYQRPPLSKGFLLGKVDRPALALRADAFYSDNRIELVLGTRVAVIDRAARKVVAADGRHFPFDRVILAAGARPRPLPLLGAELDGVLALRSLADAILLRESLHAAASVVVIGGGFIGLEVAAVLVQLGKPVTVLEMQDRVLARGASPVLSVYMAELHRRRGVRVVLGAGVARILGEKRRAVAVETADWTRHPADLIVVATGIQPNDELAAAAALPCRDGILVDALARTGDPAILAAGDCTRHPSPYAATPLRLESVQNALDQAKTAGALVAGVEKPYAAVPWFWSDQYETKLQIAGLQDGHDAHAIRGDIAEGRFSIFYFREGTVIAVDSLNRPADHMLARRLVAARARLTSEEAADPGFDPKSRLPQG
jgi:3-phenylpropionate/trans-cinnamate dioxygenase ferredoxin reductase subunit